jgi:hypothetical protein
MLLAWVNLRCGDGPVALDVDAQHFAQLLGGARPGIDAQGRERSRRSAVSSALIVSRVSRERYRAASPPGEHAVPQRHREALDAGLDSRRHLGKMGTRCSVSTARARTFPARICGIAVVTGMTTSSTSPPIIAVIAW